LTQSSIISLRPIGKIIRKWRSRENLKNDFFVNAVTREQIEHVSRRDLGNLEKDILRQNFPISLAFHGSFGIQHEFFVIVSEVIEHKEKMVK
jgi:hypothetical protein